jgi:hypothetical protein
LANSSSSSGAAVTTWNYDGQRGWLTSQLDNNNHGPTNTYTAGGRLSGRTWARETVTTYSYNAAGDLATVSYLMAHRVSPIREGEPEEKQEEPEKQQPGVQPNVTGCNRNVTGGQIVNP